MIPALRIMHKKRKRKFVSILPLKSKTILASHLFPIVINVEARSG